MVRIKKKTFIVKIHFLFRYSLFANSHDRDVDGLPAHAGRILYCAGHGDFGPGQVRPEPLPDHSHQR